MAGAIMIVDDDRDFRTTLHEILQDEGWGVVSTEDGYQAIQLASMSPFDLVFMDIRMPGIDGVETFLKIKETLPECMVVMMTGHADQSLIKKALREGAITCLRKPVSIEQVLEIASKALPQR